MPRQAVTQSKVLFRDSAIETPGAAGGLARVTLRPRSNGLRLMQVWRKQKTAIVGLFGGRPLNLTLMLSLCKGCSELGRLHWKSCDALDVVVAVCDIRPDAVSAGIFKALSTLQA